MNEVKFHLTSLFNRISQLHLNFTKYNVRVIKVYLDQDLGTLCHLR